MKSGWLLVLLAAPALAGNATVQGNIVVVNDPTGGIFDLTQHPLGLGTAICEYGAQGLYQVKDDDYDIVVTFTTMQINALTSFLATTPQGNPVRNTDQGVAFGSWFFPAQPSAYNSPATLKHCAYMGPVAQFPMNPDDVFQVQSSPFGGETGTGVSGIGVLGHEVGHHWLVWAAYDKGDGMGPVDLFRGNTRDMMDNQNMNTMTGNLHWSAYADTHSVMYGNKVTDNFDGTLTISAEEHKYGEFDQYLMGLRGTCEVSPMLVINDGTNLGYADFPLTSPTTQTMDGTGVRVTVDDVIRADGVRAPSYTTAQHCWRVAFVLVTGAGQTPSASDLALVEAYRQRWETWFTWATDGRGSVDTRLDAIDACPPEAPRPDVCAPGYDGGHPELDAGHPEDAGQPEMDAGQPDAGHGGEILGGDGGPSSEIPDAGEDPGDIAKLRPGCGCQATPLSSLAMIMLLGMAAWRGVRPPRRRR